MLLPDTTPTLVRRADYTAPAYWIDTVDLCFDLDPAKTRVLNKMRLRRNPDVKWRQLPSAIEELNVKQAAILDSAARLVKGGGRLVYATCSILREENESIAEQFLATHPDFELLPMSVILAEQKVNLDMHEYLKLSPERHETDGFFAAAFTRKK